MYKEQFTLGGISHPLGDVDHKLFSLLALSFFVPDHEQNHNTLVMFSHPAVIKIVVMSQKS